MGRDSAGGWLIKPPETQWYLTHTVATQFERWRNFIEIFRIPLLLMNPPVRSGLKINGKGLNQARRWRYNQFSAED